jgi:hypothetical protein
VTVAEWSRHWLTQVAPTIKPRAVESYLAAVERRIIPALGTLRVTELQRHTIRAFLAACLGSGRADGTPLARNSARLIYAPFRAMLALAVDDGLPAAHPAQALAAATGSTSRRRRGSGGWRSRRASGRRPKSTTLLDYTATHAAAWLPVPSSTPT